MRLAQFVIVYAAPYMISDISYGTFSFFGAFTFVSCIICFCLMPEKKVFVLEDMHFIFEDCSGTEYREDV
jgi:Sugar (and other) transporter.